MAYDDPAPTGPGGDDPADSDALERYRLDGPPRQIGFGITNFCNLSCKFCDVGTRSEGNTFYERLVNNQGLEGHHERRTLFPREELLPVVEQIADLMPDGIFSILHAEPMIHPKIADIIRDFTSRGLNLSVTTNGTSLKKYARQIVEAGLNNINVSMEGPPDVNDEIRGEGTFARAYEGILEVAKWKKALGVDRPTIRIQTVLTATNVQYLDTFLDMWINDGIAEDLASITYQHLYFATEEAVHQTWAMAGVEANPVCATNDYLRNMDLDLYAAKRQAVAERVARGLPFMVRFKPDLPSTEHADLYFHRPEEKVVLDRCEFPLSSLYIGVDGTVSMSPRCALKEIRLGTVYEQSLQEIWNAEPILRWRRDLAEKPVLPVCNRCCAMFVSKVEGDLQFVENPGALLKKAG